MNNRNVPVHSRLPKHVLLVVRYPVGGIRTYLRYVYRNFDTAKWRFTIIAPEVEHMRVLLEEDLVMHDIAWVKVHQSAEYGKMTPAIFNQLAGKKYDLIHSHGFTSGLCAALPAFSWRIPHLMTSHDVINENQFPGLKGKLKMLGMAGLFTLIDKVQSVSHDAQDNLLFFFPTLAKKKDKCLVIPNGIETERFLNAKKINLRAELELDEDVFLIGFFGRFMNQKGFGYLVEAIEKMKAGETELPKKPVVVTLGEGGFFNREKRLIQSKNLESSFRHMRFTPNVAGVIKGVDVVVMPSLWEACGLLAMETLVCGTPLIASDCIGLREVIQHTPTIKAPIRNSKTIAEAITAVIKNPRKEIYLSFVPEAVKRFDVQKGAQRLENLYAKLMAEKCI